MCVGAPRQRTHIQASRLRPQSLTQSDTHAVRSREAAGH